jgi:hypothetical protein
MAAAGGSRRLLQTDTTAQLTQVLQQIGTVQTQQTSIQSQMTKLQQQVDQANQLAQARANDNRLIDLIQVSTRPAMWYV